MHQQVFCGNRLSDRRETGCGQPCIEGGSSFLTPSLDDLFRGGDFRWQRIKPGAILHHRHHHDGGRVFDVTVHRILCRVVEERGQLVELPLRQRIKLVVVTDGTASGDPHPDLCGGIGSVPVVKDEILLRDRAPFTGGDVAAIKARCNLLIE